MQVLIRDWLLVTTDSLVIFSLSQVAVLFITNYKEHVLTRDSSRALFIIRNTRSQCSTIYSEVINFSPPGIDT